MNELRRTHEASVSTAITRLYLRQDFDPALLRGLAYLTSDATGESFSKIGLQFEERAPLFDFIVTIEDGGESVGYGGYRDIGSANGIRVLYESAKMVFKTKQGRGYGRLITKKAIAISQAEVIAARTQNPAEALSIQRALGRKTSPFDGDLEVDTNERRILEEVASVLGIPEEILDPANGLCKGMYGERFGDYVVDYSNEEIGNIARRFKEIGLNQDRGDAVLLIGKI